MDTFRDILWWEIGVEGDCLGNEVVGDGCGCGTAEDVADVALLEEVEFGEGDDGVAHSETREGELLRD